MLPEQDLCSNLFVRASYIKKSSLTVLTSFICLVLFFSVGTVAVSPVANSVVLLLYTLLDPYVIHHSVQSLASLFTCCYRWILFSENLV